MAAAPTRRRRGASDWIAADPREASSCSTAGPARSRRTSSSSAPFLRRTANVLGLDFRGHGGSDDAPDDVRRARGSRTSRGRSPGSGSGAIRRVALVGSSMGGVTALASVAVLGDGRLALGGRRPGRAGRRPSRRRGPGSSPSSRTSVAARARRSSVASRMRVPFGRRIADRAFARMARTVGARPAGDPADRRSSPLLEDVPLLLVHGTPTGPSRSRTRAGWPRRRPRGRAPRRRGRGSRRGPRGRPGRVRGRRHGRMLRAAFATAAIGPRGYGGPERRPYTGCSAAPTGSGDRARPGVDELEIDGREGPRRR